jgi:uncharacterized membrane protein YfcA
MRPAALLLNVLVAGIATAQFQRAHSLSWRLLLPFAASSVPLAFVGGMLSLPATLYRRLVGGALLVAAVRLAMLRKSDSLPAAPPALAVALVVGAAIGLLSGLTGVGGAIFLSPLLLLLRWADPRATAGVSAAFVLVNSIAALLGDLRGVARVPLAIAAWAPLAAGGGLLGARLGTRRLAGATLRRVLAVVLVVAGLKLMLT